MNRKTLIAAALAAGSLVGIAHATPAVVAGTTPYAPSPYYGSTQPYVYQYTEPAVIVQAPPPAPIYESVPAPRQGYIWAPGHYAWDHGRYEWRHGEWIPARPGYAWQAAHWEQRADGSWYLVGGTWVRTDSYAGVDDGRRGPWGDRDGDGVMNRDDRYRRDPNRW